MENLTETTDTWTNSKGEKVPLFRRDKEMTDEQNEADAAAFRSKHPGTTQQRIEPAFDVALLKTGIQGVYQPGILTEKTKK